MIRLIVCLLMSYGVTAKAQNVSNAKLYGQGIHAYNNGEYETAFGLFNAAIEQGTDDPRVFLFRGLVLHHQGKTGESLADLRKGAELEAGDKRGFYPVPPALTRVQGKVRIQIETLRREARANLITKEKILAAARYEEQKTNEATALRKPMPDQGPVIILDPKDVNIPLESPFASPKALSGIKSNPENVTVSKRNAKPSVDDKDPLANLKNDKPMPANPTNDDRPPAGNNPFAPGNNAPPANNNPPAGNNGDKDDKRGGTLGAIFGSLNPFAGGDAQPAPNA
ncbi:MAG: hypothetical protein VX776_01885, partial [Planctomycetota bacterium]|nr:hypothetical protein [Planctomycetota bacterium]